MPKAHVFGMDSLGGDERFEVERVRGRVVSCMSALEPFSSALEVSLGEVPYVS